MECKHTMGVDNPNQFAPIVYIIVNTHLFVKAFVRTARLCEAIAIAPKLLSARGLVDTSYAIVNR